MKGRVDAMSIMLILPNSTAADVADALGEVDAGQVEGVRAVDARELERGVHRDRHAALAVDAAAEVVFGMHGHRQAVPRAQAGQVGVDQQVGLAAVGRARVAVAGRQALHELRQPRHRPGCRAAAARGGCRPSRRPACRPRRTWRASAAVSAISSPAPCRWTDPAAPMSLRPQRRGHDRRAFIEALRLQVRLTSASSSRTSACCLRRRARRRCRRSTGSSCRPPGWACSRAAAWRRRCRPAAACRPRPACRLLLAAMAFCFSASACCCAVMAFCFSTSACCCAVAACCCAAAACCCEAAALALAASALAEPTAAPTTKAAPRPRSACASGTKAPMRQRGGEHHRGHPIFGLVHQSSPRATCPASGGQARPTGSGSAAHPWAARSGTSRRRRPADTFQLLSSVVMLSSAGVLVSVTVYLCGHGLRAFGDPDLEVGAGPAEQQVVAAHAADHRLADHDRQLQVLRQQREGVAVQQVGRRQQDADGLAREVDRLLHRRRRGLGGVDLLGGVEQRHRLAVVVQALVHHAADAHRAQPVGPRDGHVGGDVDSRRGARTRAGPPACSASRR